MDIKKCDKFVTSQNMNKLVMIIQHNKNSVALRYKKIKVNHCIVSSLQTNPKAEGCAES